MSKGARIARIFVLTAVMFVLIQVPAQIAMEIHFPMAIKIGSFTAVLFIK